LFRFALSFYKIHRIHSFDIRYSKFNILNSLLYNLRNLELFLTQSHQKRKASMAANETFRMEDISFSADGLKLRGVLHLPADRRPPVVVGSHGLLSSSNSPKQIALAHQCNRFGIAYFRFDHRGCGRSDGDFDRVTSLEGRRRDLVAAVAAIKRGRRLGLFGSSMGATVCLSAAGVLAADAVVTFAAPIRSDLKGSQLEMSRAEIAFDAGRHPFDISEHLTAIRNVLIFHGDADDVVPIDHAREIYSRARQPKKIIIQNQGDHPMSNPQHQAQFVREASLWFKQYLIG
jgi:alpha-beta hydrolase superfamily lysophospholipase